MIKFLFPGGGQKVNLSDFKDLHNELIYVLEKFGSFGPFVASGLLISGPENNASMSEGLVYLGGEFVKLAAQANLNFTTNPTYYLKKGNPVASRPKNFTIGGIKNTRITTSAELVNIQPLSGDYIPIKFNGHQASMAEVLGRKILPIGTYLDIDSLVGFDANGLGSGIWQGWAICNGLNGTPDLRGRFIVSYANNDADYNAIGKTGGEKKTTLTLNQLPKFKAKIPLGGNGQGAELSSPKKAAITDNNVTNNGNAESDEIGGNEAHENRPPYYVLIKIKKIA